MFPSKNRGPVYFLSQISESQTSLSDAAQCFFCGVTEVNLDSITQRFHRTNQQIVFNVQHQRASYQINIRLLWWWWWVGVGGVVDVAGV